jgi:hypothetical protein
MMASGIPILPVESFVFGLAVHATGRRWFSPEVRRFDGFVAVNAKVTHPHDMLAPMRGPVLL